MGQLSDRLGVILAKYGIDPASRQSDIHALAALELTDEKAAHARFHALKREAAEHRRADLLRQLRAGGRVSDVPAYDTSGMDAKEIEREIRTYTRALSHLHDFTESFDAAQALASQLGDRHVAWDGEAFATVPFDGLAQAAEAAEKARLMLAREARVAKRTAEARRRTHKLKTRVVAMPELSSAQVPDAALAHALLDDVESRLDAAERLENAHSRVVTALKDPAIARWKGTTRKRILREAQTWSTHEDIGEAVAALAVLAAEADRTRVEAAALSEANTRARRSGRAAPTGERKAGDMTDGYG